MTQELLAERFGLKIHQEKRDVDVYTLNVATSGAQLRPSRAESCTRLDPNNKPTGVRQAGQRVSSQVWCGAFTLADKGAGLDIKGISLAELCTRFTYAIGRDVIDKTGLAGMYDVHLDVTFADVAFGAGRRSEGPANDSTVPQDPVGAIARAVRHLGLKLGNAKAPAPFVVVDHISKPTEN